MSKRDLFFVLPCLIVALSACGSGNGNNGGGNSNSATFAYITNRTIVGSYTQCKVNESGIESDTCSTVTPTGNGALSYPLGIAYNAPYIYIVNGTGNSYTKCYVGNNGIDMLLVVLQVVADKIVSTAKIVPILTLPL